MPRRVRENFEIRDYSSLDELIGSLVELRNRLPADDEPEIRLRGDDIFGRTLTISHLREQRPQEQALDRRYAFTSGASMVQLKMAA